MHHAHVGVARTGVERGLHGELCDLVFTHVVTIERQQRIIRPVHRPFEHQSMVRVLA